MPEDTPEDRWIAAGACLVVSAIFALVALWAMSGIQAAGADLERFGDRWRARPDIEGSSAFLIAVAGLSGIICFGMLGLGVWIPLAGRIRGRGGRRRSLPVASSQGQATRPDPRTHPRSRDRPGGARSAAGVRALG